MLQQKPRAKTDAGWKATQGSGELETDGHSTFSQEYVAAAKAMRKDFCITQHLQACWPACQQHHLFWNAGRQFFL